MTKSMRTGIGAGLASVLLLAGCSSSSSGSGSTAAGGTSATPTSSTSRSASSSASTAGASASAAIKASIDAAKQAKTFRVVAAVTDAGKPLKLDLHYGSNGVDGSVATNGTQFKIKTIGQAVYFEATSKFWREQGGAQGDALAKMFGDKWARTSTTSQFGKGFAQFANSSGFLTQFTKGFSTSDLAGAKQVGTSNVGGTPTTTYADDTKEGTIDIAASGTPYPLKIVLTKAATSNQTGTITLSDWNTAYTVEPPSSSVALPA